MPTQTSLWKNDIYDFKNIENIVNLKIITQFINIIQRKK